MPERLKEIEHWLSAELGLENKKITPASSDASFRRYFRVAMTQGSRIIMDAPPEHENCQQFVTVARAFRAMGLNVPEVLHTNLTRGFLLLTDLGSRLYLDSLDESNVDRLYGDAIGALIAMQVCGSTQRDLLPVYDRALLMTEMELFREWFLQKQLGLILTDKQHEILDQSFELLVQSALDQPQVCVHRDFHSRNLMVNKQHNPGILDFQDAVFGPITYDLVSLLRDCYVAWPEKRVADWAQGYFELAVQSGLLIEGDEAQFMRWFDLMGVQRHLKAIGIFSRLNIRDSKPDYLQDIPRTLDYILDVSANYDELGELNNFLNKHVVQTMRSLCQ